jgi:hypothetical protein
MLSDGVLFQSFCGGRNNCNAWIGFAPDHGVGVAVVANCGEPNVDPIGYWLLERSIPGGHKPATKHPYAKSAPCSDVLVDTENKKSLPRKPRRSIGNNLSDSFTQMQLLTCPVTVIGGSHDAMVSPAFVLATAQAYGVYPIFVEGTAHMVPIEAELQALAKRLLQRAEKNNWKPAAPRPRSAWRSSFEWPWRRAMFGHSARTGRRDAARLFHRSGKAAD